MYIFLTYRIYCGCVVFLFKQKTAYEMRISDWSSDVCSSDLCLGGGARLLEFRCHHPDILRQRPCHLLQDLQARRVDAVVVGDQDAHYFDTFSIVFRPPVYGARASGTAMLPSSF